MKEQLELLIQLQKTDSAIIDKTTLIKTIPQKISSFDSGMAEAQALYDRQKQKCDSLEKKKKEKERSLEDLNERVKKQKAHLSEIKTNKEYQAYQREIEAAEKERYAIEDEILSFMESVDTAAGELKTEEARIRVEKEKVEAYKKELDKEVKAAEGELEDLKLRRAEQVSRIDGEVYKLYLTVLKAKRWLAVAEAMDERCLGCNMSIPPQIYVELKKNERIIQCPQCTRILFWKGKPGNNKETEALASAVLE